VTLSFDGTVFEAQAGFTPSEMEQELGLSVDNLDAEGALQSDRLDAAGLQRGDFDHAGFEIWRVNWNSVTQRMLLRSGHLGEVTHDNLRFSAELRGLSHLLAQERGRLFSFGCDATVGDARCGVNINAATFKATAIVTSRNAAQVTVSGLSDFDDDWFSEGRVSGAGIARRVRRHRKRDGSVTLDLFEALPDNWLVGTSLDVTAGCDRQFTTCRSKFSNAVNFRGFPHMPTSDFVMRFASDSDANDGQALVS
jgi:uncharacterized phage protein (TIGR02218 family)